MARQNIHDNHGIHGTLQDYKEPTFTILHQNNGGMKFDASSITPAEFLLPPRVKTLIFFVRQNCVLIGLNYWFKRN